MKRILSPWPPWRSWSARPSPPRRPARGRRRRSHRRVARGRADRLPRHADRRLRRGCGHDAEKLRAGGVQRHFSGDARISMLVSGQLDIVVADTSATLERARERGFHHPLQPRGPPGSCRPSSGIASLEGESSVVGRGTTGKAFIKEAVPEAKLVYVDHTDKYGVDAAIEDSVTPQLCSVPHWSFPGLYSNDPISIGARAIRTTAGSTCSSPTTSSRVPTRRTRW